ncbi:MAG: T9SS type A sorting domain-containing protein [Bacteroidetes bacterium]|nr:T9SS type A sorting domain-containing protein [Bacteroidota bacterium]
MKNNNERNNIVYSKSRLRQAIIALTGGLTFYILTCSALNAQPLVLTVTNPNICPGNCGTIQLVTAGGTTPHYYNWSNGATTQNINTCPGTTTTYTVTVTDAVGSTATETAVITVLLSGAGNNAGFISSISPSCGASNGSANIIPNIGSGPYTYNWNNGATTKAISTLDSGRYMVTVTDNNGCSGTATTFIDDSCNLVWPGDANRDLIANNNDILAIGVGYGSTGSGRPGASIYWGGQGGASNWSNSLTNGTNYKHVDCNGNGTINASDTTAVKQNYGLTHALKLANPEYINGLPDLAFSIPTDTALSGTTVNVPISLGSNTNQANGVYGLAFSITYDPKIVDTTKLSLSLNGSWLGTNGTDLIYITKNFGSMGRLDVGITRIDHTNISGFGKIGDLSITMKDDISLKAASKIYKTLTLDAVQIKAISNDETLIPLNVVSSSVVVENADPMSINKYKADAAVRIYPNPASGLINLELNNADVKELKLVNIIGETVWSQTNAIGNKVVIDAQTLPAGTYYLSVTTSQERIIKQVNVIR